ncbi:PleD family two-component system response regulator [Oceanicoccus sp. KOV_DT_Chl]|uniref:response regulator n=1 Tax=Oceanicoccus sp. KOV_DT_Chl TaxID=1904639 RepID=UPI000C7E15DB|nr:response regulator [Oceanicoccus sp. KOV_DT_Chl]
MQLALIVDDSKTARFMLRKMLDKHRIEVAMVESGQEALDYLQQHQPDVIFMDHMMPGMDGFSAVKAIKSNPVTANIPIVMHTTKQGDIYLGQAKALGAIDILAKPAKDQDLLAVLDRVNSDAGAANQEISQNELNLVDQNLPIDPMALTGGIPIVTQSFDRPLAAPQAVDVEPEPMVVGTSFWGSVRQWLVVVIWLMPILWLLNLYFEQQQEIQQFERQQGYFVESIEWLLNQQPGYDYGELPLAGDRLVLLKGVVERLQVAGFKGVIRMEGYVGDFCLSLLALGDGSEVFMLPAADLPLLECDVIGLSTAQALAASIEQSDEFSEYVQDLAAITKDIRLEMLPFGASNPLFPYPDDLRGNTSGDWNAVALKNNRVKFVLLSD